MRDDWRARLRREVARFRLGWRGALLWSLRITVAATANDWVIAGVHELPSP